MATKEVENKQLKVRPPIVVVLGHVDHGKTTLLDYIRKTNVVEKEAGGITQHIGAYQIKHNDKIITFIDTPGHEAFSQMRSRGAKVADIAVLVVAADEGVKPQTEEVISYIKQEKIPVIVALNKIDKPQANPEKVIGELVNKGLIVEERGGDVPIIRVSAKTGQGIDELLEMILLVAEMEELKADYQKPASGVVIESYLDSKRGPTATFLVTEGTLKIGDIILSGGAYGKVKILENFKGQSIEKATPSTPAVVVGLNKVPTVGEIFKVEDSEKEAEKKALEFVRRKEEEKTQKETEKEGLVLNKEEEKPMLNLILKADVQGSLEAIEEMLANINQEKAGINIVKKEVGDVSDSDVKLADSTDSLIIGFRVKVLPLASSLAKRLNIKIKKYDVIYELVEGIKKGLSQLLGPEIEIKKIGQLKVLAIFRKEKNRMIIGGKVISGRAENRIKVNVIRDNEVIGKGKVIQLQHNKQDVLEVEKGREAGILLEGEPIIEEGDILEFYKEETKRIEL